MGAIAPSGRELGLLITSEIGPQTGPVLELGAGTGSLTHHILARGVVRRDLTVIENSSDLALTLQARFPGVRVLWADAAITATIPGPALFGAVVSGLPLLAMPQRKVRTILAGAVSRLAPGGAIYQFTYRPACPVAPATLEELGLEAESLGVALVNVPPAWVFRLARSGEAVARLDQTRP
ncbi:methyltransferase domain-containing protein [Nostoc sp. NIES-2111]